MDPSEDMLQSLTECLATLDLSFQLVYLLIRCSEQPLYVSGISLIVFLDSGHIEVEKNQKTVSALEARGGTA